MYYAKAWTLGGHVPQNLEWGKNSLKLGQNYAYRNPKLLQLLGTSSPRPPTGASPLDPTGGLLSPRPPVQDVPPHFVPGLRPWYYVSRVVVKVAILDQCGKQYRCWKLLLEVIVEPCYCRWPSESRSFTCTVNLFSLRICIWIFSGVWFLLYSTHLLTDPSFSCILVPRSYK